MGRRRRFRLQARPHPEVSERGSLDYDSTGGPRAIASGCRKARSEELTDVILGDSFAASSAVVTLLRK